MNLNMNLNRQIKINLSNHSIHGETVLTTLDLIGNNFVTYQ